MRLMECRPAWIGLIRLEAGQLDDLPPLLGLLSDDLAEVGGRAGKYVAAEVGHARLDPRIGESGVYFPVEPVDDFGRRALGGADAEQAAHRIARHGIAD